jgi:hypothetical protein
MKLEYKILWIDDLFNTSGSDSVEAYVEAVEDLLERHGFLVDIRKERGFSVDDITNLSKKLVLHNPYDFIIFDYDLGKASENGSDIAKQLRQKIYTDMIFYSATPIPKLRKLLYKNTVDGVFVVSKDSFEDNVKPIIEDHIKRMSDINNMRGLLLDEMSQCDAIIRDVLNKKFEKLPDVTQPNILKELRESYRDSCKSNLNKIGFKSSFSEDTEYVTPDIKALSD